MASKVQPSHNFEMGDDALLFSQFRQRFGECGTKRLGVRIGCGCEQRGLFDCVGVFLPGAYVATATNVEDKAMGYREQKGAFLPNVVPNFGAARQLDENLLKDIAGFGFLTKEIQGKSVDRSRMFVV